MQWRKIIELAMRAAGEGARGGRRLLEFAKRTRVGQWFTSSAKGAESAQSAVKATRRVAEAAPVPENTGRWYDHWGVMLLAGALGTHYALDRTRDAAEQATSPDLPPLVSYGSWALGLTPGAPSPDSLVFGAGFVAAYAMGGRLFGSGDLVTPLRALYSAAREGLEAEGEGRLAAFFRKADELSVDLARSGMRLAFSAAVGSLVYDTAVRTAAGMVAALARPAPRYQTRRRSVQSRPTLSRAVRINPEATGDLVLALHRTGGKGMVIRR